MEGFIIFAVLSARKVAKRKRIIEEIMRLFLLSMEDQSSINSLLNRTLARSSRG